MNYISEILEFYNFTDSNQLGASAISLWHALMYSANKLAKGTEWPEWFTVTIGVLESRSGLKQSAINDARNRLVQLGLIEVQKRSGNQCARYRLLPFNGSKSVANPQQIPSNPAAIPEQSHALDKLKRKPEQEQERARAQEDEFGNPIPEPGWKTVMDCYLAELGMLPHGMALDTLQSYVDELGVDVVCVAIEQTNKQAPERPQPFLFAILKDWAGRKINTVQLAKAAIKDHENKAKRRADTHGQTFSEYDSGRYQKLG